MPLRLPAVRRHTTNETYVDVSTTPPLRNVPAAEKPLQSCTVKDVVVPIMQSLHHANIALRWQTHSNAALVLASNQCIGMSHECERWMSSK